MRFQRSEVATLVIFAALVSTPLMAELHSAALTTSDPAATRDMNQPEAFALEDLSNLPPTAAGTAAAQDEKAEIPLHFVPLTVQAFQEMDKEGAEGKKVPTANMLPFTF